MKRDDQAGLGTLRGRAMDAARALIEEQGGADRLLLRQIAARIGSGVATLYYHFADKDALLAAVAIEGWGELAQKIERSMEAGRFAHRIDAASAAFLTFIRRNPQLYALMQTAQSLAGNAAVRAAERQAFATFQAAFHDDPRAPPERVEEISLVCWVLGRGIASAVHMQGEAEPGAADKLVRDVLSGFGFLVSERIAR